MLYQSINSLDDFNFHDTFMSLISYQDKTLTVSAKYLNIRKNKQYNPSDIDMEIKHAILRFTDFSVSEYLSEIASVQSPLEQFLDELSSGIDIFDIGMLKDGIYYLDAFGKAPFLSVRFLADSVTIEWDSYFGPSWYEDEQ